MYNHSNVAASASGVAEVKQLPQSGDRIQVACRNITTGTGTVTITVKPGGATAYQSITDGTIDLTAPIGFILEGKFNAIKATSSSGSDVYELEVLS